MVKTTDKEAKVLELAELAVGSGVENPVVSVVDPRARLDILESTGMSLRGLLGSGISRVKEPQLQIGIRRVLGFVDDDTYLAEAVEKRNDKWARRLRRKPFAPVGNLRTGNFIHDIQVSGDKVFLFLGGSLIWMANHTALNAFEYFGQSGDAIAKFVLVSSIIAAFSGVVFTAYANLGFTEGYGILRSTNPKPLLEDVVTKSTGKPDLVTRIEAIKAYDELVNRQAQIGIVEKLHEENPGSSDFRSAMIDSLRSSDGLTLRTAIDGHIASRTNFGNLSKTVKEEDVGSITIPDFDSPLYQSA